MQRKSAGWLASAVVIALGLACGEDGVADEAWARLSLAPAGPPRPRVVAAAARQLAPASGVAARTETGAARIVFAGSFELSSFDRVRLRVSTQRRARLVCKLERGTEALATSTPWELAAGATRATAHLDFPLSSFSEGSADRLVIVAEGYDPGIELLAVELLAEPLTTWLPAAPPSDGELASVGGERRRGVGLSNRRPLAARLRAAPGSELRFSHGIPEVLRVPGVPLAVVVVLTPRGGSAQTVRVPVGPQNNGDWEDVRIPLRSFAGREVAALFRLDSGSEERELGCVLANARVSPASGPAPAVLLVTSDAHRADQLGVTGGADAPSTPALDRLAARGVLFEDCFAASNLTNPAHIALMTGLSPRDTRVVGNYTLLPDEAVTLAERFRDRGYLTFAAVGARHLAGSGLEQGFDRIAEPLEERRPAAETIDALLPWLDESAGTPLFLWLHLFDAHTPYTPPADLERRYYPPERDPFDPALPAPQVPPKYAALLPPGVRDLEYVRALYKSEITYLDRELARVLEHPRLRDALVAFSADHGEALGEHGVYWDHDGLYPEMLHVPLILAWPAAPAGRREARAVSALDVGSMLLGLAERARDASFSLPHPEVPVPRFALAAHGDLASLTHDGWHAIFWLGLDEKRHTLELYDLRRDPTCSADRAVDERVRAREMRRALIDWLAGAPAPRPAAPTSEDAQQRARRFYGMVQGRHDGPWVDPACHCPACAAAD